MHFNATNPKIDHSDNLHSTPRKKVFGIGWAKKGTTTLGRCFEILGYNHQSQNLSLFTQVVRADFRKPYALPLPKKALRIGLWSTGKWMPHFQAADLF
jgi:hypothetical protein